MSQESWYLFRHAVVQDAAYSLQLPSDRDTLHGRAVEVMEALLTESQLEAGALDLAMHAGRAATTDPAFQARQLHYLRIGAQRTAKDYRFQEGARVLAAIVEHPLSTETERIEATAERGAMLRVLGRSHEAEALLTPLIHAASPAIQVKIRNVLGGACLSTGRIDEAIKMFTAGVEFARDNGQVAAQLPFLANLALCHFELQQLEAFQQTLDRAMALAVESGSTRMAAVLHGHLARHFHHEARLKEAEAEYRKAIEMAKTAGDMSCLATNLSNLAELMRAAGLPEAEAFMREACELAHRIGDRALEASTLGNYALLLHQESRLQEALKAVKRACDLELEAANRIGYGFQLTTLAQLHEALGDREPASAACNEAMAIAQSVDEPALLATALGARGRILNDPAVLLEAVKVAERSGDELLRQSLQADLDTILRLQES